MFEPTWTWRLVRFYIALNWGEKWLLPSKKQPWRIFKVADFGALALCSKERRVLLFVLCHALYDCVLLALPTERQRSFSNAELSVCRSVKSGGGENASVTFFLFFGMELLWDDINRISKDRFGWIVLKVLFQGRKGQILDLFTHLSMLFSGTEVLPNFLAPCSFIGMMSMLS